MQCINVIQQRIEECKIRYTDGFMLMIYGTSTGSHSIEVKGKRQLTNRGYSKPPIVDVNGNTIAMGEQGAHGPGGESVFDCGSSMVMSKAVETNDEAALAHAPDPGERHRRCGQDHAQQSRALPRNRPDQNAVGEHSDSQTGGGAEGRPRLPDVLLDDGRVNPAGEGDNCPISWSGV